MRDVTCSVDGCEREMTVREMCYQHWKAIRDEELARTPEQRMWSRVNKTESCWLWTGFLTERGYGHWTQDGKTHKAHRLVYQIVKGQIPRGMELDHLCRRTDCVNPDHMEPVTRGENWRRTAIMQRTHCRRGHEMTPENTYVKPREPNSRICKTCARENQDKLNKYRRDKRAEERAAR